MLVDVVVAVVVGGGGGGGGMVVLKYVRRTASRKTMFSPECRDIHAPAVY